MTIRNEQFNSHLFESLEVGDMVWAKMPLSSEKLNKIEDSHRVRPYLVLEKRGTNSIIGYQTSSSKRTYLSNYETYALPLIEFGLNRNSFLNLSELYSIPAQNILSKICHLPDHDLMEIRKRILILSSLNRPYILPKLDLPYEICEGDVIKIPKQNCNLFYVHALDKQLVYCYPITTMYMEDLTEIIINGTTYFIDFGNQVTLQQYDKVFFRNIASTSEITIIRQQKVAAKHKLRQKRRNQIGAIYETKYGKVMYLYKTKNGLHYGVNLNTHQVRPINDIASCEIVEVYSESKVNEMIKFLYNNLHPCPSKIASLYNQLVHNRQSLV